MPVEDRKAELERQVGRMAKQIIPPNTAVPVRVVNGEIGPRGRGLKPMRNRNILSG